MKRSENATCTILLCSDIVLGKKTDVQPLNMEEWGNFLNQIQTLGLEPGDILARDFNGEKYFSAVPGMWQRMEDLLSRGISLALALERLDNRGIDVVTFFDDDYPTFLKKSLQEKAPPVLFYAGNLSLAGENGIAVVGSGNALDHEGLKFMDKLLEKTIKEGSVLYAGGAENDDVIETEILQSGGSVVSFIADSLVTRIRQKDILDALLQQRLLLLSDAAPEEGFSEDRAKNRIKYIFASTAGAFVAAAEPVEGPIRDAAAEAIRNGWTTVFAWDYAAYPGNASLIKMGAVPYKSLRGKIKNTLAKNAGSTKNKKEAGEPSGEELADALPSDFEQLSLNLGDGDQDVAEKYYNLGRKNERENGIRNLVTALSEFCPPEEIARRIAQMYSLTPSESKKKVEKHLPKQG